MSEKTALIFPGMGPSSFSAVGKFMVLDPYVRRLLPLADKALGYSLLDRFYESDEEYSEYTQVAFLINSLALAHRAEEELGIRPDYCAGPSFGQKAAAVWTGSLDFPDVIRMTAELARCEREYFTIEHTDVVTHTVMRVPDSGLRAYLSGLAEQGHWYEISGRLDDGFVMVSLSERLLEDFTSSVSAMGGYSMSTMRPPVHAKAFHPLRRKAAEEVFPRYGIRAPHIPVIADQDGRVVETADGMRTMLLDTFDVAIDWPAVVNSLVNLGVRTVYVTGPENLFRRVQCTVRNFDVVAVDPKTTLQKMLRPVRSGAPALS
ncbi:ACP S-malonyltransferase [Streptomyces chattanoogensis]|uniref:ACP S-malonyltransferase n=1 Tax=Streptomyces chattanoogensis TaxID=66876 RepID=UPI00368C5619